MDDAEQPPSEPGRPSRGPGGPSIDINDPDGRLGATRLSWLRARAEQAGPLIASGGELRVRIVGDDEMSRAHERYSGVEGTTDVLTFDLGSTVESLDADAMVCVDEAERASAGREHDADRELLLYIVHAALHCVGYDDKDPESFERMHAREDEILESIGVGATFARKERAR